MGLKHASFVRFGLMGAMLLLAVWACGDSGIPEENNAPLYFHPATLPGAQLDNPYEVEITISNASTPVGEIYVSSGTLPQGLTLEFHPREESATLRGVPEEQGTFEFTLRAWCYGTNTSGQADSKDYVLAVE